MVYTTLPGFKHARLFLCNYQIILSQREFNKAATVTITFSEAWVYSDNYLITKTVMAVKTVNSQALQEVETIQLHTAIATVNTRAPFASWYWVLRTAYSCGYFCTLFNRFLFFPETVHYSTDIHSFRPETLYSGIPDFRTPWNEDTLTNRTHFIVLATLRVYITTPEIRTPY